jgi:hypothetical protein
MGVGACRRRASSSKGSRACWVAEPGRQRHRPRAQLGARRPQRIRGLVGVAGLDPPAARAAAADVDLVADAQRAGLGQLLHMLARDPFGDQLAAAARTPTRQPDHHDPIDPLGWLPVRVPAVGRAGLAPAPLGSALGRPWRTGRPAAWQPGATPPPHRPAARWPPAAARPRPPAARSPRLAARVRPAGAAARPPAAAAPHATRRSRPQGGRCAPGAPPGQPDPGQRPNPRPPSTQDPKAATSPSTVKDPLSQSRGDTQHM